MMYSWAANACHINRWMLHNTDMHQYRTKYTLVMTLVQVALCDSKKNFMYAGTITK